MKKTTLDKALRATLFASAALFGSLTLGQNLTRTNHYVPVVSTAPAMAGETALLYVRQVSQGAITEDMDLDGKVVLLQLEVPDAERTRVEEAARSCPVSALSVEG